MQFKFMFENNYSNSNNIVDKNLTFSLGGVVSSIAMRIRTLLNLIAPFAMKLNHLIRSNFRSINI